MQSYLEILDEAGSKIASRSQKAGGFTYSYAMQAARPTERDNQKTRGDLLFFMFISVAV
jgi:hypothetical protein